MYTIGEFSRITNITVKALRVYHDKGLLTPSFIDESTNYRYYANREIEFAHVISTLKAMQFSLVEIKDVLNNINDDADLMSVLADKQAKIIQDITSLNNVSSAIDFILTKEKEAKKIMTNTNEVTLKQLPNIEVITQTWQGQYSDTGKAIGKLYRTAGRHVTGTVFNLYFDSEYKEIATLESCLPVKSIVSNKLRGKDSSIVFKKLPGGHYYTLLHVGPYEDIGVSYAKIFQHIKACGHTPTTPSREVYIKGPGMLFKGNPAKYITEIQIPFSDLLP